MLHGQRLDKFIVCWSRLVESPLSFKVSLCGVWKLLTAANMAHIPVISFTAAIHILYCNSQFHDVEHISSACSKREPHTHTQSL